MTCWTCHRGVRRPEPIESIVEPHAGGGGPGLRRRPVPRSSATSTTASAAYDFSERPLVGLAQRLADDNPAAAQRFLELNLEYHPQSAMTLFAMAGLAEKGR